MLNLDTGRLVYFIYNDGSTIRIHSIATDEKNNRILVGDNTGFVREIEKVGQTTDTDTAISFDVQSKDFTLQTRKHFPRWVKYDVDGSDSGVTVTGELYLDGALHQSHSITKDRDIRRRLVKTGNGSRVAHRLQGSGVVTIHAIESE
ncbi:hypothetical protein LCGC14_3153150 [marine sediment metagenome]|uniref:Uncharacterized protein n=1 Tax=marine sediment metagenome TaxID=412755 RepID=A0A0F8YHX8_9ZZZZ